MWINKFSYHRIRPGIPFYILIFAFIISRLVICLELRLRPGIMGYVGLWLFWLRYFVICFVWTQHFPTPKLTERSDVTTGCWLQLSYAKDTTQSTQSFMWFGSRQAMDPFRVREWTPLKIVIRIDTDWSEIGVGQLQLIVRLQFIFRADSRQVRQRLYRVRVVSVSLSWHSKIYIQIQTFNVWYMSREHKHEHSWMYCLRA